MNRTPVNQDYLQDLLKRLLADRKPGEHFFASLAAENSQFIRINAAKVRQVGTVEDCEFSLSLLIESKNGEIRRASRSCTLTGLSWKDSEELKSAMNVLRDEVPQLPIDPYAQVPHNTGSSETITSGKLLDRGKAPEALLDAAQGIDIAGIYAAGPIARGMFNSAGQMHWFETETYSFDYSVYTTSQRALKGTYAGKEWDPLAYARALSDARLRLEVLERPARQVTRGDYRTYIAPAGVSDLVGMLSWRGISEAAIRQGDSPLRLMRSGERRMSAKFSLYEDFSHGLVPRFNSLGELAPKKLTLIQAGELKNSLVSARSAKEYSVQSNGATDHEGLRSPVMEHGDLHEDQILARLGTGLYLSNLHYLNWSDQSGGRITGMTRYACFWVEDGKIVSPIENLRWDDSLFTLLGSELEAVTSHRALEADVGTYERRNISAVQVPGILLSKMSFTL